MPTFIELQLSTGERRHVETTDDQQARNDLDRWAKRTKTSWIETVEGSWVNPDHVVSAQLVQLETAPTAGG